MKNFTQGRVMNRVKYATVLSAYIERGAVVFSVVLTNDSVMQNCLYNGVTTRPELSAKWLDTPKYLHGLIRGAVVRGFDAGTMLLDAENTPQIQALVEAWRV